MKYRSTRGLAAECSGAEAVFQGLAPDGGLFLPVNFDKKFDWKALMDLDFEGQARAIFEYFFDDLPDLPGIVRRAYEGKFSTPEVTPLQKVGGRWVLELFHGPTSAFKDVALSALPVLLSEAREKKIREEGSAPEILILTATSGDTGKAALEGFRDVPGIRIHVFYPYGGVSPVQERQMTSQEGANVRVSAIRGNFDDAQTAVKEIFARVKEGRGAVLSSANSINIGRLVPQIVYYFKAYADLLRAGAIRLQDPVDFTVPTGNFGDILAGYLAAKLGLPVGRLVCASNRNNILTDFLMTGVYDKRRPFYKTGSPSMDILVSSNLERLLFLEAEAGSADPRKTGEGGAEETEAPSADLRDSEAAAAVRGWMKDLSEKGVYTIPAEMLARIRRIFVPGWASEDEVAETIKKVFKKHHYLMDPHTAVAWCVAEKIAAEDRAESERIFGVSAEGTERTGSAGCPGLEGSKRCFSAGSPGAGKAMVVLSTASPYKFPRTVLEALGRTPGPDDFAVMEELHAATRVPVPKNLAALREKPVRFTEVLEREALYDVVREEIHRCDCKSSF